MKIFTMCMFGFATGVISGVCGLHFANEPVKYLMVNLPLIACFGGLVTLITDKGN